MTFWETWGVGSAILEKEPEREEEKHVGVLYDFEQKQDTHPWCMDVDILRDMRVYLCVFRQRAREREKKNIQTTYVDICKPHEM